MKAKHQGKSVGFYGATFHKRAEVIYKTITECHCFFIRKVNWHKTVLSDLDESFKESVKKKIILHYQKEVLERINKHKNVILNKIS